MIFLRGVGMSKKVIGVGIIGYGFMGKTHAYGYQNLPLYYKDLPYRAKLVGVCNRTLSKAEEAKEDLGFDFATNNSDDVFECPDIDVISICTPNAAHVDDLIKAIKAGKHIYCDKPMVVSTEEIARIRRAISEQKEKGINIVLQMALQNRFFPSTLRAKQLIEDGKLGQVTAFRAKYLHSGSVDANKMAAWRFKKEESGGGVLFDLGSHVCDLVYYLLGEYDKLLVHTNILHKYRKDAAGNDVEILNDDHVVMMAKMKCGVTGTIEASKLATGINDLLTIEIHGTKGAITLDLSKPDWLYFFDNTIPEEELGGERGYKRIECVQRFPVPGGSFPSSKQTIGWLRSHAHCLYSFLDSVYYNKDTVPGFEEGAYIQDLLEKAYKSAENEEWVEI